MGLTVPYFVSSPRAGNLVAHAMGCWLQGSSHSGLTSVWANNEITKPIYMQKKKTKSMKGQRRALELQESGGCSAASAASAQHVHAARRAVSALQTRLLLAKCFQILTSSEAASALAVAVSAKPLQHQVSCFRLSKLLWLVLTLFRLLTLKLRYILSQFLYIAGRDGLFAKIGIGWGGLKRQGKDLGFLVESTNGLNLRDDYPQILGDSTKALIWRQSWLLNMCFFVLSLGASKKNKRTSNQRVGMSSP